MSMHIGPSHGAHMAAAQYGSALIQIDMKLTRVLRLECACELQGSC